MGHLPARCDGVVVAQAVLIAAQVDGGHIFPVVIVLGGDGLASELDDHLGVNLAVGGDALHQIAQAQAVVVQLLGHVFAGVAVGAYLQLVGALALDVLHGLLVLPLEGGDHDDHRGHADDDAQHGQEGAHLLGDNGLDGHLEGLLQIHAKAPSLPPS